MTDNSAGSEAGEMFGWLKKFDKIFVTGPQRSGTRICAQMIAYDTGHEFIDEQDFGMDSLGSLRSQLRTRECYVVQCPALCRHIHMFSADDTAIVLMRRSVEDILASQRRLGWPEQQWLELSRYDLWEGVSAEVKYRFWDDYQRERIEHAFEIDFERLAGHSLWVPKHLRGHFRSAQTMVAGTGVPGDARLHPYRDVLCEERLDQATALLVRRDSVQLLNQVGWLIWTLCDGTRTRGEVLQALKAEFADVEEEALARDLDRFIQQLLNKRFLWFSAGAAGIDEHRA